MFKSGKYLAFWYKPWSILLFYGLLAILLTHPTFWHLQSSVAGAEAEDSLQYTWLLWWSKESILTLGQLPSNLTVWGWPEGIYHPLLYVTPYLELTGLPLVLFAGPIAAYNLQILLALTLSGFTAYLLGYTLTRNRLAGFIAGLIFTFSAHRWSHLFAGHLPHITIYWAPLFTWAMWRLVQAPNKKRGLWMGLTAGLTGLVHLMHVAYWLAPTALVLLIWGWHNFAKHTLRWWPRLITASLWGVLPLALLVSPFYLPFFVGLNQSQGDLAAGGLASNATDLLAYLAPAPTNPLLAKAGLIPALSHQILPRMDSLDEGVAYLGVAGLALTILSLTKRWRLATRPWLWLTLVSGLLALGPFLKVGGQFVTYETETLTGYILMPYALLADIPLLSWGRTTGRLNQTLMFGISMLSAFGVMTLLAYFKQQRLARSLVIGIAAIFILESLVIFPMHQANPAGSRYYDQLQAKEMSESGGILDLPLESRREVNSAMFYQMYHRRPIVGGYIHRNFEHVKRNQRFANLLFRPPPDANTFAPPSNKQRLAALRSFNITTVVVHKDLVSKAADQAQLDFAATLLGEPAYEDEQIRVYHVPPGEPLREPLLLPDPTTWKIDQGTSNLFALTESDWHVYAYTPHPTWIKWTMDVTLMANPTVLSITSDTTSAQRLLVTKSQQLETLPVALPAGFSRFNWGNQVICQGNKVCVAFRFDHIEFQQANELKKPLAVWNEDSIQLMNFTPSFDSETGDISLELYWLPLKPLDAEPTIFIHVFDAASNLIAQSDHRLLGGQYPPSAWLPGVLVPDITTLSAPKNDDWRNYSIYLGLYDVITGTRFPVSTPETVDDSILLPISGVP